MKQQSNLLVQPRWLLSVTWNPTVFLGLGGLHSHQSSKY